jgi:hypothetical protein
MKAIGMGILCVVSIALRGMESNSPSFTPPPNHRSAQLDTLDIKVNNNSRTLKSLIDAYNKILTINQQQQLRIGVLELTCTEQRKTIKKLSDSACKQTVLVICLTLFCQSVALGMPYLCGWWQ